MADQTLTHEDLIAFEFPEPKDGQAAEPVEVKVSEETQREEKTVEEKAASDATTDDVANDNPDEPTPEELASYSDAVQKRIKKLVQQKHEERRAREAAAAEKEQLRTQLTQVQTRAHMLEQQALTGETAFVSQAQKLAETEMTQAKESLLKAYNEGSPEEFIKAQEAFNTAQMRLERVRALQARKPLQQPAEAGNVQPTQAAAPTINQPSSKAKAWMAENKWFGKDEDLTNFARGLHLQLVTSGVDPESEFYYQTIGEKTRKAFPQKFAPSNTEETPRTKPGQTVAPAGRAQAPKRVVLNPSQVALATRLGIPLAEYAKQVVALESKNG